MTEQSVTRKHPFAKCEECPLYEIGAYTPSTGPEKAKIAFIGEAPGYKESKQGVPFVGESGKLLDTVMTHHDIERKDVFLSNACLCRPPDNATPARSAILACQPRLIRDLEERGVETAVVLGNSAAYSLLGQSGITKLRVGPGKESRHLPGVRIIPTLHPAAALRQSDLFPYIVTDIGKVVTPPRVYTEPQYLVVDTRHRALQVIRELASRQGPLVIDIEVDIEKDTAYDHPNHYGMLCIGIAYAPKRAVVFAEPIMGDQAVLGALGELLRNKQLIAQNGKFDLAGLYPHLGPLKLWFDTMLASYTFDERPGVHGLKFQAVEYLGAPQYDDEIKKYVGKGDGYGVIPRDILYRYNAFDVACTWELWEMYEEKYKEHPDLRRVHNMLVAASNEFVYVELNGIGIDRRYLNQLTEDFLKTLDGIEQEIDKVILPTVQLLGNYDKAGSINPRSPLQIKKYLKDKGVTVDSTDKDTIEQLVEILNRRTDRDKHTEIDELLQFCGALLKYRREHKLYSCVDKETEILTQRGWLQYSQVQVGDQTLSINPKTGLSEWDVIEGVHLYSGSHDLVLIEGRDFSSLTTHDHRWLTYVRNQEARNQGLKPGWRWKTTDTLSTADRIPKSISCSTLPTESKYTDAFVELVGWIWTEGSIDGPGFNIIQSHEVNAPNVGRIRGALEELCPSPKNYSGYRPYWSERKASETITEFYIGSFLATEFWKVFLEHKVVDPNFIRSLTRAQLQLFVDISIAGDGTTPKNSLTNISQKGSEQLFAVQLACTLLGIPTRLGYQNKDIGIYGLWLHTGEYFIVKRAGTRNSSGLTTTNVKYEGTVWCVTTKNANWLAKRKGSVYYTGNTYVKGVRKRLYRGRVYPTFLFHGTTSGRLACRNPNLMNQPREARMRRLYVPSKCSCERCENGSRRVFVHTDGSQMELRVLTFLAQEPYFRDIFNEGIRDLFDELTPILYPDRTKENTSPAAWKELRIRVKAFVYGLCVPQTVPILTRRGWLTCDEVQPGDETIGYDFETGTTRWTKVTKIHKYDSKPVVNIKANHLDLTCTPNHRWIAQKWRRWISGAHPTRDYGPAGFVETQDIKPDHRILLSAKFESDSKLPITDDEAAVLGWLLSDGSLLAYPESRHQEHTAIYQDKNSPWVPQIERVLEGLGHTRYEVERNGYRWRLQTRVAQDLLRRAGMPRANYGLEQYSPEDFILSLSNSQRKAFLTAFRMGDGVKDHQDLVIQAEGWTQKAFELAAYLEGYLVRWSSKADWSPWTKKPCWKFRLSEPKFTDQKISIAETTEEVPVWCVETELGSWTMRSDANNVVLTGNSYGREAYSIAQEYGIPESKAREQMNLFFGVIPEIVEFRKEVKSRVFRGEDLITPFGRHRRFMLITKKNWENIQREALAFLPQSTASDIALRACTNIRQDLKGIGWVRNFIHDAVLAECHIEDAEQVGQIMEHRILESAHDLVDGYVKFATETTIGDSWGDV